MTILEIVGIGTGNPEHLTAEAVRALSRSDLVLLPHKGDEKAELATHRLRLLDAIAPNAIRQVHTIAMPQRDPTIADYERRVADWHRAIARAWSDAMRQHSEAACVTLMVWGDPSLYDSSLRIAGHLDPAPSIRVIPGISAPQMLAAVHGLVLNEVGGEVLVTTGRRLKARGWPDGITNLVVMLDDDCSFRQIATDDTRIWWGAYLGMPQQLLAAGRVADVGTAIVEQRAAARERHGWIMDIYLLRR